jgi:ubiquinone/menaquinone biosynthesis C-methylase UbiE
MTPIPDKVNEQASAEAFSKQSAIFDEIYAGNTIVNYKRERVRAHVLQYLQPGSHILELNSGTGEDTLFFAQQGHYVYATDIAEGMQNQLKQKVLQAGMQHRVGTQLCSFTQLEQLQNLGPYDLIFSNFAGLNCTGELHTVLASFAALLKPGGVATLVILPKFCLWEMLLIFKGKFKTATRRLFSRHGVTAHVEGTYFKCWYYNPAYITNRLSSAFSILNIEGLCTIVPPSYMEGFAEKHPRIYRFLKAKEDKLKSAWPWKFIGDYYIISLQKKF